MDIAKYVKFELTWQPDFEVWRLIMRMPAVTMAKPISVDWTAEEYPKEISPANTELFMEQGHVICLPPSDLFSNGPQAFSNFIVSGKTQIFQAISNEELANAVRKHCTQVYNNDTLFRLHCDFVYKPQNCESDYTGKVETGDQLKYEMPGLEEKVKHPIWGMDLTVERCIVNLNDSHKWSREQIADWLETLDVDLTFKVKEDV